MRQRQEQPSWQNYEQEQNQAAITYGMTGLYFGVLTPETGVLTKSVNRRAIAQSREVSDEDGDIVGHAAYGFKADYVINATALDGSSTTGTGSGLNAAGVGTSYNLANGVNFNGISGGVYIIKQVEVTFSNENWKTFSANVTQYPSI